MEDTGCAADVQTWGRRSFFVVCRSRRIRAIAYKILNVRTAPLSSHLHPSPASNKSEVESYAEKNRVVRSRRGNADDRTGGSASAGRGPIRSAYRPAYLLHVSCGSVSIL